MTTSQAPRPHFMRPASRVSSRQRLLRTGGFTTALWLCACAPWLPHASASDAAFARERSPRATLSELEEGRALYVQRCASCHSLKDPASVPAREWPAKIAEMRDEHDVELAPQEAKLIETYLYAISRRSSSR